MNKCIVYSDSGGVKVVHPVPNARLIEVSGVVMPAFMLFRNIHEFEAASSTLKFAETENEFIERVTQRSVPPNATQIVVDKSSLPDRSSRKGWVLRNGRVEVDQARLNGAQPR